MNSTQITFTEAQTLTSAYTNNPYSTATGSVAGFSLPVSNVTDLLDLAHSATIAVYWGNSNGILVGTLMAASNSDGSPITNTSFYANGQSVTKMTAEAFIANYDLSPDADTPNVLCVYFERSHIQDIVSGSNGQTVATSVVFSFAREADDTLNIVATNNLGTVFFNRSKGRPKI